MKNINFQVVTFDVARKLFNMGQEIHSEVLAQNGKTESAISSKDQGHNFVIDARNTVKKAVLKTGASNIVFKVAVEEIPSLSFEEVIGNPEQLQGSNVKYRFVYLYMRKGDNLRYVARYPIVKDKSDSSYMMSKSLQHNASNAKEALILSSGDYCRLNGPVDVHSPLDMISSANENGYDFDLENTGVTFNGDSTYWEFNGNFKNVKLSFSYRIYSVKLAGEVVRAIRTNSIPVPLKKIA